MIDEKRIAEIERKLAGLPDFSICPHPPPNDDFDAATLREADVRDLIAEVRRLREQNKALDPYGRGIMSKSTEF